MVGCYERAVWLRRWLGVINVPCGYRDGWGRHCTQLVAIDALVFDNHSNQFETSNVMRELNKVLGGHRHISSLG